MPVRETIECWNCGSSFCLDERENCPKCGEYPSDEPKTHELDVIVDEETGQRTSTIYPIG